MNDKRKGKGGRPRSKDPKTEPVGFRCTPDEYKKLEEMAISHGVTIGEYCRLKGLGGRMPKTPVPAINIEKYQELARLSANLNQMMRAINEKKVTNIDVHFIDQLSKEVTELRKKLLGITSDD